MDEAPGWDSIDAAIQPLVGSRQPHHWGTGTGLPDQDGIWGVSAYLVDDHWFFVTYGLSELFTKVSDDATVSGWGEELTFRLRAEADEPPVWAARLMARLGQLVFQHGAPFLPGARMEISDAVDGVPPAVCWTEDPLLPPFVSPFGSVQFVATVGLPSLQLELMRDSSTGSVLDAIRGDNPLLVGRSTGLEWT
ncbi:MAG: suppressor of fused domain protein [Acidimicrobiia bacterium]